jgi:hypothetical protein
MTTSTPAATPDVSPVFPPGRYGRRREPGGTRRWPRRVALAIGVVITLAIAVKLYGQYGSQDYTPTVLNYTNISDSSITVEFQVDKADPAAECTLQAFTHSGVQVGEAQVPVGRGDQVRITYALTTTEKAYIVQVPACQSAG